MTAPTINVKRRMRSTRFYSHSFYSVKDFEELNKLNSLTIKLRKIITNHGNHTREGGYHGGETQIDSMMALF